MSFLFFQSNIKNEIKTDVKTDYFIGEYIKMVDKKKV